MAGMAEAARLLAQLIAIPSPSGAEGEILALLEGWLRERGFPVAAFPVPGHPWPNLVVNPQPRPRLLIDVHVDTVPPQGGAGPVGPVERDGMLYGLGSADAKGGLVAVLLAVEALGAGRLAGSPITLALTVDEENRGLGAEALARGCRPEMVVAVEPTGLTVGVAEAGTLELAVEVRGRAAHGSVVEGGRNAIREALGLLRDLEALPVMRAEHPRIGQGAVTPLFIQGGERALVIPERCLLHLDLRWLPGIPRDRFLQEIEGVLARHPVAWEIVDLSAPFETPEEAPLVQAMARALETVGLPAIRSGMPSWTDAEPFARFGAQAVVFGPGDLSLAHTPAEHIALAEILQAARVFQHLLEAFARP